MTIPRVTMAMLRKEAKRAGVDLYRNMFNDLTVEFDDTSFAWAEDAQRGRAFLLAGLKSLPDAKPARKARA